MKSRIILGAALALAIVASAAPVQAQDVPAACVTSLPPVALPVGVPAGVWVGDEAAVQRFFVDVPAGWYDVTVEYDQAAVWPVVVVDGQDVWEGFPFRVGLAEPGRVQIWAGAEQHYADDEFQCAGYSIKVRRVVPVVRRMKNGQ